MKENCIDRLRWIMIFISAVLIATVARGDGGLFSMFSYRRDCYNQRIIAKAYLEYVKVNNLSSPSSLAVLVDAGLLPKKSEVYEDPRRGMFRRSLPYNDGVYVVFPFSVPISGDSLHFLAMRDEKNGGQLRYDPMINAEIRDGLVALFRAKQN